MDKIEREFWFWNGKGRYRVVGFDTNQDGRPFVVLTGECADCRNEFSVTQPMGGSRYLVRRCEKCRRTT